MQPPERPPEADQGNMRPETPRTARMRRTPEPPADERSQATWHALTVQKAAIDLQTDPALGLSSTEAALRLQGYGRNELAPEDEEPWWKKAFESLTEPLVLLLIAVGVLYAIFGRLEDAITIFVVITAVSAVETVTEARAKRAIKSLGALASPEATVIRDGAPRTLPTGSLVPGDLVVLVAGSRVPADLRLVSTSSLRMDESSLTGESVPVSKQGDFAFPVETALGDRVNLAFSGATVTAGQGKGLVVATGQDTELGRIATLARSAPEPETPLQRYLRQLSVWLLWLAVGFSVLVPVLSVFIAGRPWRDALLEGLTLAFATIPEELPILITVVLGLGAYRLAREHAITKRLQAAETLGSVSVIGTDKTGTLTENRMRLADVYTDGLRRPLAESAGSPSLRSVVERVLAIGMTATGAEVVSGAGGSDPRFIGDPTDTAFLTAAADLGWLSKRDALRVVEQFPFDDVRKRIAAVYEVDGVRWVGVKGAPERVLEISTRVLVDGHEVPLDAERRDAILSAADAMAADGERVVAVAERRLGEGALPSMTDAESDLLLVAMVGLIDPPRPEAAGAVRSLRGAGVRVVMITGDHPGTARAIAERVGIDFDRVAVGTEVARASGDALRSLVRDTSVFARIAPEDKLRLVEALQANGEVVAVTGDGVNDAPALRQASIGIAMGQRGTDVAREASDLVLSDDNFATVASAVRGGRVLFENLWKAIRYYLAAKVALITASLVAVLAGLPLPFAPVQIIVLELFMDLGASTTFVAEPAEGDVMLRPPRDPRRPFMDRSMVLGILGGGLSLAAAVLVAYLWSVRRGLGMEAARTAAFAAWLIGHLVLAAHMRSEREPLIQRGLRLTRPFAIWVAGALGLALLGPTMPFVSERLYLVPLQVTTWGVLAVAAILLPSWWEIAKWLRWRSPRATNEGAQKQY